MCDVYEAITNKNNSNFRANNYDKKICFNSSSGSYPLQVQDSSYTDATAFKNSLNGRYVVYDLATPIVYQLSQEQVNSIKGLNNIWSNAGQVKVTYRTN